MTTRACDYAAAEARAARARARATAVAPALRPPQQRTERLDEMLEKEIDDKSSPTSSSETPSSTSENLYQLHRSPTPLLSSDTANNATADLEKQETVQTLSGSSVRQRLSRAKSTLYGPDYQFTHPLAHVKTAEDVLVDFDGPNDPYKSINWPMRKKVITTMLYGFTTMGATWASSVYAPAFSQISEQFHVGREVSLLGLSLLLVGFGLGPCIWGPASELYGRKYAVLLPYFVATCFSFGTAAAKDIQTVLLTRFFTGFFGSAPVTNTGGVLSDIWAPNQRGNALVLYAMSVVAGPVLGPIIGSAIVSSDLQWRWTEYITGIMQITLFVIDMIILEETYPPVLLEQKARRLRYKTGNWALHCKHEEWDVSISEMFEKFGKRPMRMLLTPICFFVALYASFVYGILYLNLAAFPIIFEENRGWGPVIGSLPFLALFVGVLVGAGLNILNTRFYVKAWTKNNFKAVPEARLPPMMIGSIFFTTGLFIMGWTATPKIHWVFPNIGAVFLGLGFFTIFQCALNYLVDTFQMYAASAIAANTFLRSVFASAFPLIATPMYHKLGIPWASILLGFVAAALIPIPFVLYKFGPRIRARGVYSRPSTL